MKNRINIVGLCMLLGCFPSMADEPSELVALRKSYENEIKRVTQPVNATYLKALQQMKDNFTRSSKLEQALAVDAEIKKTSTATSSEAAANSKTANDIAPSDLAGTSWSGIGAARGMSLIFKPDGEMVAIEISGTKKFGWKWGSDKKGKFWIQSTGGNPAPVTISKDETKLSYGAKDFERAKAAP